MAGVGKAAPESPAPGSRAGRHLLEGACRPLRVGYIRTTTVE